MKTIFALAAASLIAGSAYASDHDRHMIEFDADSVIQGTWSFDKSKTRGAKADNDSELDLTLNYAYSLANHPRLQLAGSMNYLKDTSSAGDIENYGFMVGAIMNHNADLMNSAYASLYAGMNWNHTYSTGGGTDEILRSVFSVGKRFALERWGLKHLSYSPEVSLVSANSTTGSTLEYAQSLEFRFLQFAVFF